MTTAAGRGCPRMPALTSGIDSRTHEAARPGVRGPKRREGRLHASLVTAAPLSRYVAVRSWTTAPTREHQAGTRTRATGPAESADKGTGTGGLVDEPTPRPAR